MKSYLLRTLSSHQLLLVNSSHCSSFSLSKYSPNHTTLLITGPSLTPIVIGSEQSACKNGIGVLYSTVDPFVGCKIVVVGLPLLVEVDQV